MHAICVAALSAAALAPADAGSPPAALYGKSVVVTWSEARSLPPSRQRHAVPFRERQLCARYLC